MTVTEFTSPQTKHIYMATWLSGQLRERLPINIGLRSDPVESVLAVLDIGREDVPYVEAIIKDYLRRGVITQERVPDDPNHDPRFGAKKWCTQLVWNGR